MQEFTLRFSRTYPIILAIVLPCLLIVPFIFLMATYFPDLSEGAALTVIFTFMGVMLGIVFLLIKLSIPKVKVTVYADSLQFRFISSSPFGPGDFRLRLADIKAGFVHDGEGGPYISLRCRTRPRRFNLSAVSSKEKDQEHFVEFAGRLAEVWEGVRG